jgi:hypothetical protein
MLAHHLLSGMVIGALVAVAGILWGFSLWATVGFYVLGAKVGLGASALGARSLLHRPERTAELATAVS